MRSPIHLAITLILCGTLFAGTTCSDDKNTAAPVPAGTLSLTLDFLRQEQAGPDPFMVTATLTADGVRTPGAALQLEIPKGSATAITDHGDGTYSFTVTPAGTGIYPVTVSCGDALIRRDALVVNGIQSGAGQPLLVAGQVNTIGYEDGITITPDGEYLFIQYGPVYFSGVFLHSAICAEAGWSMYNLATCPGKPDSGWVFNTIGPFNTPSRPDFPTGAINGTTLTHLNITVAGVANGIVLMPTIFYGFKRQSDGSYAEPFKVAFNDSKGANSPFGLSFRMTSATTAEFVVAWDNYFDHLGDDKPDIYSGSLTFGQNTNLGDVTYAGEGFNTITPYISPVAFPPDAHAGVQCNPFLYVDNTNTVQSIWTDDEQVSKDLTVYVRTAGTFPSGSWTAVPLPSKINTTHEESQPFFTGSRLYFNRNVRVVYHEYSGPHTTAGYADNANWGDEVEVLAGGDGTVGGIFGLGEPTIAVRDGKKLLFFAYVEVRSAGEQAGRYDYDLGAAWVEIP